MHIYPYAYIIIYYAYQLLLVLASSSSKYAYAYSSNMYIMHTAHKTYSREYMMLCSTSLVCIFILILLCIHRTCLL